MLNLYVQWRSRQEDKAERRGHREAATGGGRGGHERETRMKEYSRRMKRVEVCAGEGEERDGR